MRWNLTCLHSYRTKFRIGGRIGLGHREYRWHLLVDGYRHGHTGMLMIFLALTTHLKLDLSIIQGVLDRYEQITPKLVFAETEVLYAGKVVNLVPRITTVFERLRTQGMEVGIVLPSAVDGNIKDVVGGYARSLVHLEF